MRGQARQRGSKEERIAQANARTAADAAARERTKAANTRQHLAYLRSLPPEVRDRVLKRERLKRLKLTQLLGFAMSGLIRRPR